MTDADMLRDEADELKRLADFLDDELASGGSTKAACHVASAQARLASRRLRIAARGPLRPGLVPAPRLPVAFAEPDTAELSRPLHTVPYAILPVAHHGRRRRSIGQWWLGILCGVLVIVLVFAAGAVDGRRSPPNPALVPATTVSVPSHAPAPRHDDAQRKHRKAH